MADKSIDDQKLVLIDRWPGDAMQNAKVPEDGFMGTSHHNVATAVYPVGTKIQVYCKGTAAQGTLTGNAGYATFIYLKLEEMEATNTCLQKNLVATESTLTGSVADNVYDVTNEAATDMGAGLVPAAVSLGTPSGTAAMTENYYGWYWCGGVCPVDYCDNLNGNYRCTTGAIIGPVARLDAGTAGTTYGEFAFGIPAADTHLHIGYILANAS